MTLRILLVIAAFYLACATLRLKEIPQDAQSFENALKKLGRKPGPLGYFNSIYMAFTVEEAENFPNLVSLHSQMMQSKTNNAISGEQETLSIDNTLNQNRRRRKRNFPYTNITGECETMIGGLRRLCEVCPAYTDLGENIVPRYINEMVCKPLEDDCGEGGIIGKCTNTSVVQDFFEIISPSGYQQYSQPIRSCCECGLFPS